jgi:TPR repeat protein
VNSIRFFFLLDQTATLNCFRCFPFAGVAELVDALDSGSSVRKDVRVQVSPSAPDFLSSPVKKSKKRIPVMKSVTFLKHTIWFLFFALALNVYSKNLSDFKTAALEVDTNAQVTLGFAYSRGPQKNEREALYWMTMAARQDVPLACRYLGYAYLDGKGTAGNALFAEKWFTRGALKGDTLSMIGLADALDIRKKPIESVAWLQLADEHSEPRAKWRLDKILPTLNDKEKTKVSQEVARLKATLVKLPAAPSAKLFEKKKHRLVLSNGDSYRGQIENNLPNGFGERISKSGKVYQGSFKNGWEDGFGTLFSADGLITYQGLWKEGSPTDSLVQPEKEKPTD